MSERIQRKRWLESVADGLATIVLAALMALALTILAESIVLLIGSFGGDVAWIRSWVDFKFTKLLEWLTDLTGLVDAAPDILALLPSGGIGRELIALIVSFFMLCLYPAKRAGPALMARFDDETLRAAPGADFGMRWAGPLGDQQKAAWSWLQHWCFAGSGTGRTPLLRPWVMPHVENRFRVAMLVGANGTGKSHLSEAFSRDLDGTEQLSVIPKKWDRLRLSLLTKLRSWLWWRARQRSDPWDCGWIVEDSAARALLSQFLPRRATLLIADQLLPASLMESITILNARRVEFRHPVRLLIIDVTLPTMLGLKWDADAMLWHTQVQELGDVPVMNLSAVRFNVPEFRALVSAQRADASDLHLQLHGLDSQWRPLVDALEGQPILLTESIRMVREQNLSFESLLVTEDLFGQTVQHQEQRPDPPLLPTDVLGNRREFLRERLLNARAEHRETVLRSNLVATTGNVDELFEAILIASIANGGDEARLVSLLGWNAQHHTASRLSAILGLPCTTGWVPALKPAVIIDEMLRRHFGAARGADLSEATRQGVVLMMRRAWLLNPAGTLRTVGRWQQRRQKDAFVLAVLQLPTLDDLARSHKVSPSMRVEIVRALFELAVVHQGDVQQSVQALALLNDEDLAAAQPELLALIMRPDAWGLPALVLWLNLVRRCWPNLQNMSTSETVDFGCTLIEQIQHLVRQSNVCAISMTSSLRQLLDEAFLASLPLSRQLATPCAGAPAFRAAVTMLRANSRSYYSDEGVMGQADRLRDQLVTNVAIQLAAGGKCTIGESEPWLHAVMEAIAATTRLDADAPLLQGWLVEEYTAEDGPSFAWGRARALELVAAAHAMSNAAATEKAAEQVAAIASAFTEHEGIQYASALAWRDLVSAYKDSNAVAANLAAEPVKAIALAFPSHEGIQHASALAWRDLAWAYRDINVAVSEVAASRAATIALAFPAHVGIQHASAMAWQCLAWAYKDDNATATEAAAERVAVIALEFPKHEGIQYQSALAWRIVASAYWKSNVAATNAAVECVAAIASAFPKHEGIQCESAVAWRFLACAYRESNVEATEAAAERVAAIASAFSTHEGIQYESAMAWRFLAYAYRKSNVAATEVVAERVAAIASAFSAHEGIQCASAEAWGDLAWAQKERNVAATEVAVKRVLAIASAFLANEGIQQVSAEAWWYLAWAYGEKNVSAAEVAVKRVSAIASRFLAHENIQLASAVAWRILAWVYRESNVVATEAAAKRVAMIASAFPKYEGIQYESAVAWRILTWAYRQSNVVATEAAAERAAAIASAFPKYENIQYESALAWQNLVGSAVKSNDEVRVAFALGRLDDLCHERDGAMVWKGQPVSRRVLVERERARDMVKQWRQMRNGDLDPEANQE